MGYWRGSTRYNPAFQDHISTNADMSSNQLSLQLSSLTTKDMVVFDGARDTVRGKSVPALGSCVSLGFPLHLTCASASSPEWGSGHILDRQLSKHQFPGCTAHQFLDEGPVLLEKKGPVVLVIVPAK